MKYIIILCLLVGCGSGRRKYPWKPRAGQSFIGHNGNGVGILKDQDTLFLGRFKQGYKEGVFKVIYPNGDVAYQYYKRNGTSYRYSMVGGYVVQNNKAYATYPIGDHQSKSIVIGKNKKDVTSWSFPKKKTDKFSKNTLEIRENELNTYRSGSSLIFYTSAGQSFTSYKQENDFIYATYKDAFGTELYHKFMEKRLGNRHTVYNKDLAIEISKVKSADGIYQGETKNGVPHGFGELKKESERIIGFFENGMPHGAVRYISKSGTVSFGYYKNGKKHGGFVEMYGTYKTIKSSPVDKAYVKSLEANFVPLEKWYKEKWLKGDRQTKVPRINIPSVKEFEEKRGQIGKGFVKKKRYYTAKHNLKDYSITGMIRHFPNYDLFMDAAFDYYFEDLTKYDYRKGYKYRFYENDKLVKGGIYRQDISKGCPKYLTFSNEKFYPDSCEDPRFYISGTTSIIHDPVIENEKIVGGYRGLYRFGASYNYMGLFVNGKAEGIGVDYRNHLRGTFKNNYLEGFGKNYKKSKYAVGKFKKGLREGKFIQKGEYNDEYQIGQYEKGKAQGKFNLKFVKDGIKGTAQYKNGKLNGQTIRKYTKDNTVFNKFTYVDGKKQGEAICRIGNKSEPCKFKDGKRVDATFKDRETKKKARVAAQKRRDQERRERERRRRQREERERRAEAREAKRRRQRNAQIMMQNYQNQINSIKNTVPQSNFNPNNYNKKKKSYNTYKDHSKPQPKKIYSNNNTKPKTNASASTSGSSGGAGLTLTRGPKPYKQCILEENYNGNILKASYNCNDKEGTIGKARQSIAESRAWYQNEERKREEAKRQQEQRLKVRREKGIQACDEFFSKNGHRCAQACDPKIFDLSNCKAISI